MECCFDVFVSCFSLNTSLIHPREVFNPAIKASANSLILIHNHPSGDVKPSKEDIDITKKLENAGSLLGISVVDHVIVGKNSYLSFKDQDLL